MALVIEFFTLHFQGTSLFLPFYFFTFKKDYRIFLFSFFTFPLNAAPALFYLFTFLPLKVLFTFKSPFNKNFHSLACALLYVREVSNAMSHSRLRINEIYGGVGLGILNQTGGGIDVQRRADDDHDVGL